MLEMEMLEIEKNIPLVDEPEPVIKEPEEPAGLIANTVRGMVPGDSVLRPTLRKAQAVSMLIRSIHGRGASQRKQKDGRYRVWMLAEKHVPKTRKNKKLRAVK